MWSYLFARRVIAVTCFLLMSLSACTLEKETVVPVTRRPAGATTAVALASPVTALPSATAVSPGPGEAVTAPSGLTTAVAIAGDKAFTAVGASLVILDISEPTQPVRLGHVTLPALEQEVLDPEWIRIEGVTVSGRYAYLAATDGMWLVDVSNPSNPLQAGFYKANKVTAVAIVDHYALVIAWSFLDGAGGLRVVDVSRPSTPVEVGAYKEVVLAGLNDVVVNGNTAYLTGGIGTRVLDISNPSAPAEIGRLDIGGTRLALSGNFLYRGDWGRTLSVLDVSDPALPVEVSALQGEETPGGISVVDHIAYIANGSAGLRLADVTAEPVEIGSYEVSYARDVTVSNGYAYVAIESGLAILDVTDPARPVAIGLVPADGIFVPGQPAEPATIAPTDSPVVAPENAEEVTQLARFGKGRIDGVSWSPDGKLIAVSGYHGIDLYDAATLQWIHTIDAQGPYGSSLSFSPQGDAFVLFSSGDYEPSVSLWDTASGQYLRDLDTYTMPVFTPDGEAIIFSPGAPQLVRQDVRTGEETLLIDVLPHFSSVPIDYPPDLASQTYALLEYNEEDETETLYLYDMGSGQLRHRLEALVNVERIIFSPKGDLLVELRRDDSTALRLYDPASGQLRYTLDVPGYGGAIVFFSPQGELLAAGSGDGIVRVWDVSGGELLYELEGHIYSSSGVVFSPDGRVLATDSNETVRLWDTATGQLLHQLTRPLRPVSWSWSPFAFSPDGREVAAVSGSRVLFFDVTSGALQRSLDGYYFASDLVFSPDSNALITVGGYDVRTLDVHSGELLELRQSDEPVGRVTISPDGGLMAWGGAEEHYWLQVWDRTADQLLYTIEEGIAAVNEVAFSPDGQLLATRSGYWPASLVQVREAGSGKLLFSHEAGRFVFSPDGRLFATSSAEWPEKATTELWEIPTFQLARRLEQLELLAFGPDGNILASQGMENGAGVWQVTTGWWDLDGGELLQSFGSESSLSRPIVLSPDGRLLLGDVGVFNFQDIWDLNTGGTLGSINGGSTAAFSPDGRLLAVVYGDGSVQLWGLPDGTR